MSCLIQKRKEAKEIMGVDGGGKGEKGYEKMGPASGKEMAAEGRNKGFETKQSNQERELQSRKYRFGEVEVWSPNGAHF